VAFERNRTQGYGKLVDQRNAKDPPLSTKPDCLKGNLMGPTVLPIDAARLDHPLSRFYRDTLKPLEGLSLLQDNISASDVFTVSWNATEGEPDEVPAHSREGEAQVFCLHALIPQEDMRKRAFRALAKAWDCCTCHLPLQFLIDHTWTMGMTREIVSFFPVKSGEDTPYLTSLHRDQLLSLAGSMDHSHPESILPMPFIALHEGRRSRHADIAGRGVFDTELRRLAMLARPHPHRLLQIEPQR